MDALTIGLAVAGLVIGFLLAYLICRSRSGRVAADLESRLRTAQRQVTDRDRQLAAAASQTEEQQRTFATLTDDNTGLQDELTALRAELDDANRAAAELQDRLNAAAAERLGVDADLEEARADAAGLRSEIARLEEQIAGLEAERAADAESFRSLAAEYDARGGELDGVTGELNALKAKYDRERLDLILSPYLNSARARDLADPSSGALEQPQLADAETANVEQMREALLFMAAAKINADDDLRTREVDLLEANARVSALRTSVDALTSAGAEMARLLGYAPPVTRVLEADAMVDVGSALEELKAAVAAREEELADAGHALDGMVAAVAARDEELTDAGYALDSLVSAAAAREEGLAALRANLDALAADKDSLAEKLASRRAAFDGVRQRVAAALVALQALGKNGAAEDGAGESPAGELTADEPAFEDMSGGDAEPDAAERFAPPEGPDWNEPGSEDELEEMGRIDGMEPSAEGDTAADAAAEVPELDGLDAAIVAAVAAFRSKAEAVSALEANVNDLQAILDDTQAARTQLEEELGRRRAAFAALQERLGGLAGELEAAAAPGEAEPETAAEEVAPEGALEGAAAEEIAPELPEGTWEEPHAAPGQILEEAAGVDSIAPEAEAVEPFAEEEESAARFVADVTADAETATGELAAGEMVAGETAAGEADDGQQIAARLAAGVAGVLGLLRARGASIEELRGNVAEIEAARADLDGQLQANAGEIESLTAAQADLDAQVAAREGELGEIESRVGNWLGSVRDLLAGDPEALALLDAPPAEAAAEAPATGTVETVEAGEAVEAVEPAQPADTGEAEAAVVQSPAAPGRAAAIAASLSAGAAALTAALRKKETQLGALQGELDGALAQGDALQAQIADAQARFAGVSGEIAGWYDSLQADYAADPDVASALSLAPAAVAAGDAEPGIAVEGEEGEAADETPAAEVPADETPAAETEADPVALLKAGIAAVGVMLGKRSAELDEVRSGVIDLSAQEESLRGELDAQAAALTGVSERVAAWTSDLRAQFADDPEVLAALDRAQAPAPMPGPVVLDEGAAVEGAAAEAVEATGEEVEAAAAAPAPGPVALLSAGIAAVGVALGKRSAELDEARSGVVNLTTEQETLRGELDALDAQIAAREGELGEIQSRVAAWKDNLRELLAADPDALALLDAPQAEAAAEAAAEAPAAEPGQPAETGEAEPAAEQAPAAPNRVAAIAASLSAGGAAIAAALGKKETQLGALQGELDAALAEGDALKAQIASAQERIAQVHSVAAGWYERLKNNFADDPDVAAALGLQARLEAPAGEPAPHLPPESDNS
jgi:chromosome segregation ATPase